jgi:hypothetical protein
VNVYALAALALFLVGCAPALAGQAMPATPDLDASTLTAVVSGIAGTYAVYRMFQKRKYSKGQSK